MKTVGLLFLFIVLTFLTHAQDIVWRKRVSRVVDMRGVDKGGDIAKLIFSSMQSGKISVYPAYDPSKKISGKTLLDKYAPACVIDTQITIDPKTGMEVYTPKDTTIHYDSIYLYRVVEEWSFNLKTGMIEIIAKRISPLKKVYSDDGVYRGRQDLLYLDFNDFLEILNVQQHSAFNSVLQQSYFTSPSKVSLKDYSIVAKTTIDLSEPDDTILHLLQNQYEDTSLCEYIVREINNDKIAAWKPEVPFKKRLLKSDLININSYDVDTLTETPDMSAYYTSVNQLQIEFGNKQHYQLLEIWSFDPRFGKADMIIKGVAPMDDFFENNSMKHQAMFWIRYKDLQPILKRVEVYHPTNTFAMHIWDSFFLSDLKPVMEQ